MAKLQTLYATIKCTPKFKKTLTIKQKTGVQIIKLGCWLLNRKITIEISIAEKVKKKKKDVAPTFMPKDMIY